MLENVKNVGDNFQWSPEQINELKKCANDKVYFFEKYIKVNNPTGLVDFKMKRSQRKIQDKFDNHNKTICVAPRQTGASTYIMLDIIHNLLFFSNQTIAIASHRLNFSKELINDIYNIINRLPKCLSSTLSKVNKSEIRITNGSRVLTMPIGKDFCRGFAVTHLYFDNVSHNTETALDDLYNVIEPFLDFKMIKIRFIDSGPFDYFNKMWKFLEHNDFIKFKLEVEDDERFDDKNYAKQIKEQIGAKAYIQEYEQHWTFK